jgi:hypothetical protein
MFPDQRRKFPVPLRREFALKLLVQRAFLSCLAGAELANRQQSLFSSLLAGKRPAETGSMVTASATRQSFKPLHFRETEKKARNWRAPTSPFWSPLRPFPVQGQLWASCLWAGKSRFPETETIAGRGRFECGGYTPSLWSSGAGNGD